MFIQWKNFEILGSQRNTKVFSKTARRVNLDPNFKCYLLSYENVSLQVCENLIERHFCVCIEDCVAVSNAQTKVDTRTLRIEIKHQDKGNLV